MNNEIEKLQKKTRVDMICSFVVALIAVGIAIKEFWTYVSMDERNPEHLTNGFYAVFAFGIIFLLGLILLEVHKIGKPFSKKIINELRVLAVFIIIGGLLPQIITTLIMDASSSIDINFVLNAKNLIVSIIGVIIGILSEIFVYGYELQDDVDSIA